MCFRICKDMISTLVLKTCSATTAPKPWIMSDIVVNLAHVRCVQGHGTVKESLAARQRYLCDGEYPIGMASAWRHVD